MAPRLMALSIQQDANRYVMAHDFLIDLNKAYRKKEINYALYKKLRNLALTGHKVQARRELYEARCY